MTCSKFGHVVSRVALALVISAIVGAIGWRLTGGVWERVETPSMGTQAPVGSLLWVKPAAVDELAVGDFITFHPPGRPDSTYSHLVKSIDDQGRLHTGGLISGDDPWALTSTDVVGKVVSTWIGAWWIVLATPLLVIGALLVWATARLVRRDWKIPTTLIGASLVLSLALVVHQPLTRVEQLAFTPLQSGGAQARYVTTGLLPMRLATWNDSSSVVMEPGEVGEVTVTTADAKGRYGIKVTPEVPWWLWVLILVACFAPALWMTARRHRNPVASEETAPVA